MASLFDVLFGCHHKNFSFPITKKPGTYVCCLDCGKEFAYDWQEMKVIESLPHQFKAVAPSTAESFAGK
jgi:hypothetical protein